MHSLRALLVGVSVLSIAFAGCLGGVFSPLTGPGPVDYLSSRQYKQWVIEVDYATGHQPSNELLSFMHDRLAGVVDKPDGVQLQLGESLGDTDRSWSDGDLQSYADQHQDQHTGGSTVVLHLLFLAGHYQNSGVLGVTYGHGPIVIFSKDVDSMCDGALPIVGTCSTGPYYHSVVLHEFGHAMGLVNHGIPMVHPHEAATCDHGNGDVRPDNSHSSNSASVMYCAVEVAGLLGSLQGTPPDSFDANDKEDLHAAGGK